MASRRYLFLSRSPFSNAIVKFYYKIPLRSKIHYLLISIRLTPSQPKDYKASRILSYPRPTPGPERPWMASRSKLILTRRAFLPAILGIYIRAWGFVIGDFICLGHGHSWLRFKAMGLSDIIPIDTIAETHEGFKAWVHMLGSIQGFSIWAIDGS